MSIALKYGCNIATVSKQIQRAVRKNVEEYTSVNARRINIVVKSLVR